LIYYQRRALFAAPFDVNRLELTGPAVALVDDVASHSGTALPEFDVSRSGLLVYRRSAAVGERVLAWLGASGTPERLRIKPDTYLMPRLSPDGKQLALVVDRDEQQNLWIYNLIQETMTRLTFEAERQDNPAWTPDGGFIVLRAGDEMGWVRSDGGSGKVERLHVAFGNAFPRTFSPDGKWLAYSFNDPQTTWDLWTATVERGPLRLATKKPVLKQAGTQIAPAISPDGHWLAYHSTESGRAEIYVMRFSPDQSTQGGKWQISSEGGTWPVWSSNGRELFFRSPDRRVMVAAYRAAGENFGPEKPRLWSNVPLADVGVSSSYDVGSQPGRVIGIFDAEETKPDTHLRVLLNVGDELSRRTLARGKN
jgi:serine/threonine-protein kinase